MVIFPRGNNGFDMRAKDMKDLDLQIEMVEIQNESRKKNYVNDY